jgi:hypothetical protein
LSQKNFLVPFLVLKKNCVPYLTLGITFVPFLAFLWVFRRIHINYTVKDFFAPWKMWEPLQLLSSLHPLPPYYRPVRLVRPTEEKAEEEQAMCTPLLPDKGTT